MKKDKVTKIDEELPEGIAHPTGGGFPVSAQGAAEFEAQPGDVAAGDGERVAGSGSGGDE